MTTLLIILHVLVSLFLIGIVLLQHGKGADIGATFGGSSQSVFGSEGPLPLLNKITTFSAIIFMVTSLSLAYISSHRGTESVMRDMPAPVREVQEQMPAPTFKPLPEEELVLPSQEVSVPDLPVEVLQEQGQLEIQAEADAFMEVEQQEQIIDSVVEENQATE